MFVAVVVHNNNFVSGSSSRVFVSTLFLYMFYVRWFVHRFSHSLQEKREIIIFRYTVPLPTRRRLVYRDWVCCFSVFFSLLVCYRHRRLRRLRRCIINWLNTYFNFMDVFRTTNNVRQCSHWVCRRIGLYFLCSIFIWKSYARAQDFISIVVLNA